VVWVIENVGNFEPSVLSVIRPFGPPSPRKVRRTGEGKRAALAVIPFSRPADLAGRRCPPFD
jgi:hypothetical protein